MPGLQFLILGSIGLLIPIAVAVGLGLIAACRLIDFLQAAKRRRRSQIVASSQASAPPETRRAA